MIDVSSLKIGDVVEVVSATSVGTWSQVGYLAEIRSSEIVLSSIHVKPGSYCYLESYPIIQIKSITILIPKPTTAGQCVIEEP